MKSLTAKILVEQLIRVMENGNEDLPVVVATSENQLGPSPYVEIDSVMLGFDWNTGKIFLTPSIPVVKVLPRGKPLPFNPD